MKRTWFCRLGLSDALRLVELAPLLGGVGNFLYLFWRWEIKKIYSRVTSFYIFKINTTPVRLFFSIKLARKLGGAVCELIRDSAACCGFSCCNGVAMIFFPRGACVMEDYKIF